MSSSSPNPVYAHLHGLKVSDVIPENRKVISVTESEGVDHLVKVLKDNKISSVPVLNKDGEVVGSAGMLDVVNHINSVAPDDRELKDNELMALEIHGRAIALLEIGQVMDKSGRDVYTPIQIESPLSMAVKLFAQGLHKLPIVNDSGELVNLITQTDVIRALKDEIVRGHMKNMAHTTVKTFKLGSGGVFSLSGDAQVREAIRKMDTEKVSGLAILDADGKLAANFSASDARALYHGVPEVLSTVSDYLEKFSPNSKQVVCVTQEAELTTVVNEFVDSRLHHLFVVDDEFKPVGLISLTDLMRLFATHEESS